MDLKPSTNSYGQCYDYENLDDEDDTCYREGNRLSKLRTVVIFNKETLQIIQRKKEDISAINTLLTSNVYIWETLK